MTALCETPKTVTELPAEICWKTALSSVVRPIWTDLLKYRLRTPVSG